MSFVHAVVPVVENVPLARDTYRLRFDCPPVAEQIRPGQFLMLRVQHAGPAPLLGRAFALYDTILDAHGKPHAIDIVYLVVGKMTGLMATLKPNDPVEVWGPLGNGFPDYSGVDHLILVAGGIGQTPFLALIRRVLEQQETKRVSLFYGVRTADLLAAVADFERAGAEVHIASDDGSVGFKGFVTQLVDQRFDGGAKSEIRNPKSEIRLVGCGPEPMMQALAQLAQRRGVPCDLSLETPMACGIGICFSCVAKIKTADGWDYRRTCVEGPVFDAARVVW